MWFHRLLLTRTVRLEPLDSSGNSGSNCDGLPSVSTSETLLLLDDGPVPVSPIKFNVASCGEGRGGEDEVGRP